MGARAVADSSAQALPGAVPPPRRPGLGGGLFAGALAHPQRTAFRDAGDRAAWCGRPAITWSYAAAAEIVGRLAHGIGGWRLPPGSRVGLWFSGGAEAALAHLAVEAAGHLPCPMPATWEAGALSAAVEAAGLAAVLTEGRRGPMRPAEDLARVAMRHFGLRYLAAFGPGVPDGVISLDALALERRRAEPLPSLGLATFADGDPARPVHRGADALDAAVAAHLDALPLAGGERVLTLLPGHDLRGLVTGLGAALAGGASLECLLPFEEAGFRAALARPVPTRLVAPALIEAALAGAALPWTVRTVEIVRRAPAGPGRPGAPDPTGPRRLDTLVLGEEAVLTRPQGGPGPPDLPAADPIRDAPRGSLDLARGADGRLHYRGLACAAAPLPRGGLPRPDPDLWRAAAHRPIAAGNFAR